MNGVELTDQRRPLLLADELSDSSDEKQDTIFE